VVGCCLYVGSLMLRRLSCSSNVTVVHVTSGVYFCSAAIACRYNVIAIYVRYETILFGILKGTEVIQVP